jgi:hypothetical protein
LATKLWELSSKSGDVREEGGGRGGGEDYWNLVNLGSLFSWKIVFFRSKFGEIIACHTHYQVFSLQATCSRKAKNQN